MVNQAFVLHVIQMVLDLYELLPEGGQVIIVSLGLDTGLVMFEWFIYLFWGENDVPFVHLHIKVLWKKWDEGTSKQVDS